MNIATLKTFLAIVETGNLVRAAEQLQVVPGAPEFTRRAYLITNDHAGANWPWLSELVSRLSS